MRYISKWCLVKRKNSHLVVCKRDLSASLCRKIRTQQMNPGGMNARPSKDHVQLRTMWEMWLTNIMGVPVSSGIKGVPVAPRCTYGFLEEWRPPFLQCGGKILPEQDYVELLAGFPWRWMVASTCQSCFSTTPPCPFKEVPMKDGGGGDGSLNWLHVQETNRWAKHCSGLATHHAKS